MLLLLDAASLSVRNQGPPEGSREGKGARNKLLRASFQQCQGLQRWKQQAGRQAGGQELLPCSTSILTGKGEP